MSSLLASLRAPRIWRFCHGPGIKLFCNSPKLQLRGLNQIGDIYCPAIAEWPSFSESQCAHEIARVLNYTPPADVADLKILLTCIGLMPRPFVRLFLWALQTAAKWPDWFGVCTIGATARLIQLSLRGLIFSLYFGHPTASDRLHFRLNVASLTLPTPPTTNLPPATPRHQAD